MREGFKYSPQVVVLALFLVNDLTNNMSPKQYGLNKPVFLDTGLELANTPVPLPGEPGPDLDIKANAYELTFDAQRTMDAGLMYQAVAEGAVDLISAYTTDGRITAYDLRVLEDDRGAIPPYDAVVLVSAELSLKRPDVVSTLSQLQDTIDVATMRRMNLLVDEQGVDPVTVAAGFITTLSADRPRSDGARARE